MYWVAGITVILYMVLFLVSRRERRGKAPPGIMGFFYPMAVFLYQKACIWKLPIVASKQVQKDLRSLYPGKEIHKLQENYYVKKISLFLMLCLLGTLFGVAVSYRTRDGLLLVDGKVLRGTYAEEPQEIGVATVLASGEKKQFQVSIYPYQLSEQETEALWAEFRELLPGLILGKNASLEQVTEDLLLEQYYAEYPFSLEWKSSRPDILKSLGEVSVVEEATELVLTARVFYGEAEWQEEFAVTVIPPILSETERMEQELAELLTDSEKESRNAREWQLPTKYQGNELIWKEITKDNGPIFWSIAVVIAVVVFLMSDKDLHDEWNVQREEMKRAYPDVVQKLLLYLGAGMTVRAAFQKMAAEYEEYKKEKHTGGARSGFIYQEICYMCRELQAGVSEGTAYEHFGKRTGVQEYLRLSTLLAQNLKKGNSTLLQRLKEESEKASAERLQNSKKLGEEASTKLLLPMVMLLLVVMLMVIIPTFSSMGM